MSYSEDEEDVDVGEAEQEVGSAFSDSFFWWGVLIQGGIIVAYVFGSEYETDSLAIEDFQPMYQDIHMLVLAGFGFLATFLRRYSFGGLAINFVLVALCIQWGILTVHFFGDVWKASTDSVEAFFDSFTKVHLNIAQLIEGDYAAAAVLISFGAMLGKTNPLQLMVMAIFELLFYSVNLALFRNEFQAIDIGGSMVIHAFGAFFGAAASRVVTPQDIAIRRLDRDEKSVYHSEVFSLMGTIFLWAYWPSFNAALAPNSFGSALSQHRTVLNTVLSLSASCVATFVWSRALNKRKFTMWDVQQATLAGGVAVGAVADLYIEPWGALAIGTAAALVSCMSKRYLQGALWKYAGVHDTACVMSLHGLPGVFGGALGAIVAAVVDDSKYSDITLIYPARATRSQGEHALYQLGALLGTIGVAIVGGIFTGLVMNARIKGYFDCFRRPDRLFTDEELFDTPKNEIPYYFGLRPGSVAALKRRGPAPKESSSNLEMVGSNASLV